MRRATHESTEPGERMIHIPRDGRIGNEELAREILDQKDPCRGFGRLRLDELFGDCDITREVKGKGLEMFLGASGIEDEIGRS